MGAELLIISGISGAGKNTVLRAVEDRGWLTVDNLPPNLLSELLAHTTADRLAVVIDARQSDFDTLPQTLDELGEPYRLLLLEATHDTISTRYQETRRRHPAAASVAEGYQQESALMAPLRERADWVIATDDLSVAGLKAKTWEVLDSKDEMVIRIVSFGWKWGAFNGDIMFDARHLPNPHWDLSLRALPGNDPRALEYIRHDGAFDQWVEEIAAMMTWLIPRYQAAGKSYLEIAFGCTGGRHRSVAMAEALAERLNEQTPVLVHRDRDRSGNIGGR